MLGRECARNSGSGATIADRAAESNVRVTGTLDAFAYGQALMASYKVDVRGAGLSHNDDLLLPASLGNKQLRRIQQEFVLTREGPGSKTWKVR